MPYQLFKDKAVHDVVEVLEVLLENARAGNVTGIVFACTMKKTRYITNIVGHCQTNPTFAMGMLASLSYELGHLTHRADHHETR